jgi:hypothetical protein
MKPVTLASVLAFAALLCMVEQADAYLYCELKGGSSKKEWACKECSPNAICGVKEDCQAKCAKAKTPKEAESCLTLNCPPPEVHPKRSRR